MESEKVTEKYLVQQIAALGGEAYKFTSPNRKFVLDRLCVMPYRLVYFVEVKSEDDEPHPGQLREIARLKKKGHFAAWVSTKYEVNQLIKHIEGELNDCIRNDKRVAKNKKPQS